MGNEGKTEQKILRYFSQPDLASLPHNHVIPLLDEIEHEDMCFAVTPLLHDGGLTVPWFQNLAEALEAVSQSLEVHVLLSYRTGLTPALVFRLFACKPGGTLRCGVQRLSQQLWRHAGLRRAEKSRGRPSQQSLPIPVPLQILPYRL